MAMRIGIHLEVYIDMCVAMGIDMCFDMYGHV